MVNADTLAKRGAALIIEDAKLKSGLALTIEKLLESPEKLDEMRKAMLTLRSPNAAEKIADQLYELAETQQSASLHPEELHHDKH
jgi:UDP-N-acetylglucosamine:LPS N-acetylglucosamine transferase